MVEAFRGEAVVKKVKSPRGLGKEMGGLVFLLIGMGS